MIEKKCKTCGVPIGSGRTNWGLFCQRCYNAKYVGAKRLRNGVLPENFCASLIDRKHPIGSCLVCGDVAGVNKGRCKVHQAEYAKAWNLAQAAKCRICRGPREEGSRQQLCFKHREEKAAGAKQRAAESRKCRDIPAQKRIFNVDEKQVTIGSAAFASVLPVVSMEGAVKITRYPSFDADWSERCAGRLAAIAREAGSE